MTQAYPLAWPTSWPRTRDPRTATFGSTARSQYQKKSALTLAEAIQRLSDELERLGAQNVVLSTNVELRLDGWPRGGLAEPTDRGVACYFRIADRETVLACDKWDRVPDNIAAIAKHIEALRGMDRWGVGSLKQAFAGYQSLPRPEQSAPEQWWKVLGLGPNATRTEIVLAYRSLAHAAHPDTGGSHAAMARLNAARDNAMARFGT